MAKLKVALRGGFSDRNKIKEENTTIQTNAFDERTRVALCNTTSIVVSNGVLYNDNIFDWVTQRFIKHLYADVYGQVVQWDKEYNRKPVLDILLDTIKTDDYDSVLTVIEYVARKVDEIMEHGFTYEYNRYTARDLYNQVFEREYVGYRLINGEARPITDENEVNAIQEAVDTKYAEVKQHIDKALSFLSDRQAPDYANSIKESISAVERMCSIIVGKATSLGDALNNLQKKGVVIHPQLRSAFEKLFAYTNGASGVRHAGELDGADSTFEEAKFMLVSCCAFVNYLTGVMAKHS